MIYYFSGTGNSEWVAKKLGKILQDRVVNIANQEQEKKNYIKKGETVGFVFPIYAYSVPPIMMEFITQQQLPEDCFIYAVCTCEKEEGNALLQLSKRMKLDSGYTILMPNNYTILIKADKKEVVKKKIEVAKDQIAKIADDIKNKKRIDIKGKFLGNMKTKVVAPLFHSMTKNAWKKFWVQDSCISCGICEKNCPKQCIDLKEGKPTWSEGCVQCLACFHRCPKESIQYGKHSLKAERYYMKENV